MSDFKLAPDAKASLIQIARYTQKTWGKQQRNTYLKLIDDCFHTLANTPMLGKLRPEIYHTLRSHPVGKHIVFYLIQQEYIVIVHVLHENMDPDRHLGLNVYHPSHWLYALQGVKKLPNLDKQTFIDLQFMMLDERFASEDYRVEQNYVGETVGRREIYHFISPKPEDVAKLMDGLLLLLEQGKDVDPVVLAAIASFGFVFIHPFDDGNGRTHRYMIHHILANHGVSPEGVIFPISATMLNHVQEYDACLESFSKKIMPLIDFVSHDDASIEVLNDTVNLYRYFDATPMAEYLYACIEMTIENELKAELDTISAFSKARKAIDATFDLPENKKNLFLKLCWEGKGCVSKNKRKSQFSMLTDEEIEQMEHAVAPYFSVLDGGNDE